ENALIGPALAEAEPAHQSTEKCRGARGAVVRGARHELPWRPLMGLDVVDLVAEPLEPDEVLEHLPGRAAHRHHREHAEDHDLRPRSHPGVAPCVRPTSWKERSFTLASSSVVLTRASQRV